MARYDIFDVMDYGAIVYANRDNCILVTFNGSRTFNVWCHYDGKFENTDVWTYGGDENPRDWSVDRLYDNCSLHFREEREIDQARKDNDEYECGDRVKVLETGETGTIIEVSGDEPMYYVDLDDRTGEYTAEYFFSDDVELIVE